MNQDSLGHLLPPEADPAKPGVVTREVVRRLREVRGLLLLPRELTSAEGLTQSYIP